MFLQQNALGVIIRYWKRGAWHTRSFKKLLNSAKVAPGILSMYISYTIIFSKNIAFVPKFDTKHDMLTQQNALVKNVMFLGLRSDLVCPRLSMHEYLSYTIVFYIEIALIYTKHDMFLQQNAFVVITGYWKKGAWHMTSIKKLLNGAKVAPCGLCMCTP